MEKLPQRLVNIRAADRAALSRTMEAAAVRARSTASSRRCTGRGRVLVRASGTEPLIRVMVEAPSAQETDDVCGRLTDVRQDGARRRVAGQLPARRVTSWSFCRRHRPDGQATGRV